MTDAPTAREEAGRAEIDKIIQRIAGEMHPLFQASLFDEFLAYGLRERANGMREAAAIARAAPPNVDSRGHWEASTQNEIAATIERRARELLPSPQENKEPT